MFAIAPLKLHVSRNPEATNVYYCMVPEEIKQIRGRMHDMVVSASLRLKSTYDGLAH